MGIRFLSVMAGLALALALSACGGSQERGKVPTDSPLTEFEAPESQPGGDDDDWFGDDDFDDLDDLDEAEGEDDGEPAASKPSASEEGAEAP